jgi:hypothetical protein
VDRWDWADEMDDPLRSEILKLPEDMRRRMFAIDLAVKFLGTVGKDATASPEELTRRVIAFAEEFVAQELRAMPYQEYLQTPEWQKKRVAALSRANHRCQVCNSRGPLDVHHRTYERRGSEDEHDLTVLCRRCHELFHSLARLASER